MNDVTHIGEKVEDNRLLSVEYVLERTLAEVREGKIDANRLLILYTKDTEGTYFPGYRAANISCSEILALLEIGKIMALEEMGYIR